MGCNFNGWFGRGRGYLKFLSYIYNENTMDNFDLKKYISENRLLKEETVNEMASLGKVMNHPEYSDFMGDFMSVLDQLNSRRINNQKAKEHLEKLLHTFAEFCLDIGYAEREGDEDMIKSHT